MFLNGFTDTEGRNELNVIADLPNSENVKYILMAHSSMRLAEPDRNDDGFIDQPTLQLFNVYNHFDFRVGNKYEGQIILKALSESRFGGQKAFDKSVDLQTFNHYGFEVKTNRLEGVVKSGWMFPERPWKSIGIQLSNIIHDHQSYFGKNKSDTHYLQVGKLVTVLGVIFSIATAYIAKSFNNINDFQQ